MQTVFENKRIVEIPSFSEAIHIRVTAHWAYSQLSSAASY